MTHGSYRFCGCQNAYVVPRIDCCVLRRRCGSSAAASCQAACASIMKGRGGLFLWHRRRCVTLPTAVLDELRRLLFAGTLGFEIGLRDRGRPHVFVDHGHPHDDVFPGDVDGHQIPCECQRSVVGLSDSFLDRPVGLRRLGPLEDTPRLRTTSASVSWGRPAKRLGKSSPYRSRDRRSAIGPVEGVRPQSHHLPRGLQPVT